MKDLTLGGIAGYIGLICLWIVIIWQLRDWKKRKKEKTYESVPKDSWWKQTYIWQVFFRRSMYRPIASTFPWLIFIVPAMFMVFFYSIGLSHGHPLKLEEMHQVSGIVTEVHRGKGRGSHDYIRFKDDSGNEDNYRVTSFLSDEQAEKYRQALQGENKRITIWYEDERYLWEKYKHEKQIKVNNQFLVIDGVQHTGYSYEYAVKRYNTFFPNLLWWLGYSLPGWLWLWILNKKELPIHRLNKQKRYEKYNLKDA